MSTDRKAANKEYRAAVNHLNKVNDRMVENGVTAETDEWRAAEQRVADAEQNVSGLRRWIGR